MVPENRVASSRFQYVRGEEDARRTTRNHVCSTVMTTASAQGEHHIQSCLRLQAQDPWTGEAAHSASRW